MASRKKTGVEQPSVAIPKAFDDSQRTVTAHRRNVALLVQCRRQYGDFWAEFRKCLLPVIHFQKREPHVQRLIQFVTSFAVHYEEEDISLQQKFLEELLGFLMLCSSAREKHSRTCSVQLIAEIVGKLPEAQGLDEDVYFRLLESMQHRMLDKLAAVRIFAANALSRLFSPEEGQNEDPVLVLFAEVLACEKQPGVRQAILQCAPGEAIMYFMERSLDVDKTVRQVAFSRLKETPITSFSISQRANLLQQGLTDREKVVRSQCLDLLVNSWLSRDSDGDVITLLKYLDVETHEEAAEIVLGKLLKAGSIKAPPGQGLRNYLPSAASTIPRTSGDKVVTEGDDDMESVTTGDRESQGHASALNLMSAEVALFWRMVCSELHADAEDKGKGAAATSGAEAEMMAAAAGEQHELLEEILPPSVDDFVQLVYAHINAGPDYRFAGRQLLHLAKLFDFTDAAGRKSAASLVHHILCGNPREQQREARTSEDQASSPTPSKEADDFSELEEVLYFAESSKWRNAVAQLAMQVYGSSRLFAEAIAEAIAELAKPCREGTASPVELLRCLAAVELLLRRALSLQSLTGLAVEPQEVLHWLLVPAATHQSSAVRRFATQCLGLYCLLDQTSAQQQLPLLQKALSDVPIVQTVAIKALMDAILWHGPASLVAPEDSDEMVLEAEGRELGEGREAVDIEKLLERLVSLLDIGDMMEDVIEEELGGIEENEPAPKELVAEGFAKLLQKNIESEYLLKKLLEVYFSPSSERFPRLEQCLSVFFDRFCRSSQGKEAVSRVFIPLVSDNWPGLAAKGGGRGAVAARQKATKMAHYMLAMLLAPPVEELPAKKAESNAEGAGAEDGDGAEGVAETQQLETGMERLATELGIQVLKWGKGTRSVALKAYLTLMSRTATSLEFQGSKQAEIKKMLHLLPRMESAMAGESTVLKELRAMASRLKAMDETPSKPLSMEQIQALMERIVEEGEEQPKSATKSVKTPAQLRRQAAAATECTPASVAPPPSARPSRRSKSQAMARIKDLSSPADPSSSIRLLDMDGDRQRPAQHTPAGHEPGQTHSPGQSGASSLVSADESLPLHKEARGASEESTGGAEESVLASGGDRKPLRNKRANKGGMVASVRKKKMGESDSSEDEWNAGEEKRANGRSRASTVKKSTARVVPSDDDEEEEEVKPKAAHGDRVRGKKEKEHRRKSLTPSAGQTEGKATVGADTAARNRRRAIRRVVVETTESEEEAGSSHGEEAGYGQEPRQTRIPGGAVRGNARLEGGMFARSREGGVSMGREEQSEDEGHCGEDEATPRRKSQPAAGQRSSERTRPFEDYSKVGSAMNEGVMMTSFGSPVPAARPGGEGFGAQGESGCGQAAARPRLGVHKLEVAGAQRGTERTEQSSQESLRTAEGSFTSSAEEEGMETLASGEEGGTEDEDLLSGDDGQSDTETAQPMEKTVGMGPAVRPREPARQRNSANRSSDASSPAPYESAESEPEGEDWSSESYSDSNLGRSKRAGKPVERRTRALVTKQVDNTKRSVLQENIRS